MYSTFASGNFFIFFYFELAVRLFLVVMEVAANQLSFGKKNRARFLVHFPNRFAIEERVSLFPSKTLYMHFYSSTIFKGVGTISYTFNILFIFSCSNGTF